MYEKIIEQVKNGASFSVDFKKRTLHINGKNVAIKDKPLHIPHFDTLDLWLDYVEDLYDDYKYSRPTKQTMSRERHSKFKALSVDELVKECGHDALNNPAGREETQAALEVFILFSLVEGAFNPNELFAKDWFYQGADKSFIMRKDWF